jgi:integrase
MGKNRYVGVSRRGQGYQISFQHLGTRYREILRLPLTAKGEAEANGVLCSINHDIARNNFTIEKYFPNSPKARAKTGANSTITHELNQWMRLNERSLQKSTRLDYQRRIDKHLIPVFGKYRVTDLKRTDILEWVHSVGLILKPKSISNTLDPLRSMYRDLIADDTITYNPMTNLRLPKFATREPTPFNEVEIEKILNELEGQPRNFYEFAFQTGLRTSEQIALEWADVDWENKTVYIHKAKVRNEIKEPKTKAGRRKVNLSSRAINTLLDQKTRSGHQKWIFLNPKTMAPWSCDKPLRIQHWYPALDRAGVTRREPYQTRHTFASLKLSKEGMNPIHLARQMGHSDCSQIHARYARLISDC